MTPLTLDHLVIAVRDLSAAAESYTRLLGRAPSWRGSHPTYGTANVLYRIDNTYLELLAPANAAATSPWHRALVDHLHAVGEGLYAIALGTDDIDATVADTRGRGLNVGDPAPGEGLDETTGARRAWRNARIAPESTRGVRAFFIQHDSPPDALPVAAPCATDGSCVAAVDHTVIASSDLPAALAVWRDALGLDLRRTVDWPPGAARPERTLHFLRLGGSILELAGSPASTVDRPPSIPAAAGRGGDLLWGVSYRVDNVAAAVDRLRAAGVTVSDARAGRADNTAVADLKPGFSHDVRTLLIERGMS
jgi:catechol 2,3-dioxygenase-like lactoylglutathione lyase family enzyme